MPIRLIMHLLLVIFIVALDQSARPSARVLSLLKLVGVSALREASGVSVVRSAQLLIEGLAAVRVVVDVADAVLVDVLQLHPRVCDVVGVLVAHVHVVVLLQLFDVLPALLLDLDPHRSLPGQGYRQPEQENAQNDHAQKESRF